MKPDTWDRAAVATVGRADLALVEMLAKSPKYQPLRDAEELLFLMRERDENATWHALLEISLAGYVRCSREPAKEVVEHVCDTLISKQYDYGSDNILWAEERGLRGLLVRAHDKLARLQNLERRGCAPKNESVLDSWLDLCGYSALGMMVADHTFTLPLQVDRSAD